MTFLTLYRNRIPNNLNDSVNFSDKICFVALKKKYWMLSWKLKIPVNWIPFSGQKKRKYSFDCITEANFLFSLGVGAKQSIQFKQYIIFFN